MTEWIITMLSHLFHPRALKLTTEQAEYVQGLLLGGSLPADIGRSMDKRYKRKSWAYFMAWDHEALKFMWPETVAYDIDGLEYIHAAMLKLGAIKHKGQFDYYQADHPMTQVIAAAASKAPIPQMKGA